MIRQAIRLIAFDLDGTLMGADQHINSRVCRAIERTQERGVIITLATGRMFSATLPYARTLNVTAPLICYQGGWIQAPGGDVLHRISLSTPLAQTAIELGGVQNWHAVLYADGKLFVREMLHPPAFYEALLGQDITVGMPWADLLEAHTVDKVLFVAEPELIPAMASLLNQHFVREAEVVQSHQMFIEIVPQGVNKGNALAWLAQHLGIAQHEVMAAGDQGNDVSMVQWAGVGVAMGNAIPDVKQAADWIAPPVTENGAVAILNHFILDDDVNEASGGR